MKFSLNIKFTQMEKLQCHNSEEHAFEINEKRLMFYTKSNL